MAGNRNASAEGDQMKRETRAQRPPAILGAQAGGRRGVGGHEEPNSPGPRCRAMRLGALVAGPPRALTDNSRVKVKWMASETIGRTQLPLANHAGATAVCVQPK